MLQVGYRVAYLAVGPLALVALAVAWMYLWQVLPVALVLLGARAVQVHWRRAQRDPLRWKVPEPQAKSLTTRDGVRLSYYVVRGRTEQVVMIAPGLFVPGCSSTFRLWAAPLMHRLSDRYTYIYWDYRGLFNSQGPKRIRRMSIHEQAEDLYEILKAEGIQTIHMLLGHSMGVQVGLEFALLYPERVERLVLCNGGHGKLMSSGLQPLFRVPVAGLVMYHVIRVFKDYVMSLSDKHMTDFINMPVNVYGRQVLRQLVQLYSLLFGSKMLRDVLGPTYLEDFYETYLMMGASTRHAINYVRLIMELDAHSIYHLLPEIDHPVLIISGMFDPVTPAYHSFEMAELLPNCRHVMSVFSAHVTLLEEPSAAMRAIEAFAQDRDPALRFKRATSKAFL